MHTILLVDDDPTTLRLLQTLLQFEGLHSKPWSGHSNIIGEINSTASDIILMDVHLQAINGIDVLKDIRSHPALSNLPVIMTSGMDCAKACMDAGANAFFIKPYLPDALIQSIHAELASEV